MSKFTTQHYVKVAEVLREAKQIAISSYGDKGLAAWASTVFLFVGLFEHDSNRFISSKFIDACGLGGEDEGEKNG